MRILVVFSVFLIFSEIVLGKDKIVDRHGVGAHSVLFMMNRVIPNGRLSVISERSSINCALACKADHHRTRICQGFDSPSVTKSFCTDLISRHGHSPKELNYCGDQIKDINSNNYQAPDVQTVKRNFGVEYIPRAERSSWIEEIEKTRLSVANFCCGTDQECKDLMASVPVNFCETKDPKDQGRCFNATYYQPWSSSEWEGMLKKWGNGTAKNFSFPDRIWIGSISLSPFGRRVSLENGTEQIIFHSQGDELEEFIHACSTIRARLQAKRSLVKREGWMRSLVEKCDESTASVVKRYREVPGPWSGKDGLLRCFEGVISSMKSSGNAHSCNEMCPQIQVEEATAAFTRWKYLLSNNQQVIPEVIPNGCYSPVSSSHPPGWLLLPCIFQHDPDFRALVKGALLCN